MSKSILAAGLLALFATAATAQSGEIRIANIHSNTDPQFADLSKQLHNGFHLGLQYATGGTMTVAGKKIVVIDKDSKGKPDIARAMLASAYTDDKADIAVGPAPSHLTLAMLPVAQQHKKILIAHSASDSITGENWNRYIFRTMANASQQFGAVVKTFDEPGTSVAVLAQDYAYGRQSVQAIKDALSKNGAQVVAEEYVPVNTTDFTAVAQRLFAKLKDRPGRKVIEIVWGGAGNPFKIGALNPKRYGIELNTQGSTNSFNLNFKDLVGMDIATFYDVGLPGYPANEWLIREHQKQYGAPTDYFQPLGMASAIAIVEALKKTGGDTDSEKLITALEGLSWDTPKGRMTFRKEDHQAIQSMFQMKVSSRTTPERVYFDFVREIKPEEIQVPIRNKR